MAMQFRTTLTYRRVLGLAQSAKLTPPMVQRAGRFWGCEETNLSALADRFGLAKPSPTDNCRESAPRIDRATLSNCDPNHALVPDKHGERPWNGRAG
jgi:hypothetical protein